MLLGRLNVLASLDQRDDPAIAEITQVICSSAVDDLSDASCCFCIML